jgi:3-dehydroquinate dehydratase/shikimate dehydrogenase
VTVTAATTAELRRRRDEVGQADLVELRLDSVADPDVAGALADRRRPVIVTCRPTWEGGGFDGSEEARRHLLAEALTLGAEYVDLEWRADFSSLIAQTGGRRIVLSTHDYDALPTDLRQRAHAMRATGAEVVKIAAKANRLTDCVTLRELGNEIGARGSAVVIAMGERGIASRVLASRFGSVWVYAGAVADVGQITAEALVEDYHFRAIGPDTKVYGVVGSPVAHSVSPAMHNAAFRAANIDAVYLPLAAADVDDFVVFAHAFALRGASVTIPFKVSLYDRVDEAYSVARRIGAINTIGIEADRWVGGNTDASGFLQPLQERNVPLHTMRVAILGAGGAARAVAVALASSGADLSIHARERERAEAVAMIVPARVGAWPPEPGSWDVLINCTPIGMHPNVDATPVPAAALTGSLVYDLVYNPASTRLLREAETAGCRTIGGLEMLVAQAQAQFTWWTGVKPIPGVMRVAAMKRLAEFSADEDHVV